MKIQIKRKCGECTVCCEGFMSADIHGHKMHPGRPCFFIDKENHKCSIHKDRPKDICEPYQCAWLSNFGGEIPEWMKPNLSGVLITPRNWKGGTYFIVMEAHRPFDPNILYWIITFSEERGIPLEIHMGKVIHHRGPKEFQEYMHEQKRLREKTVI